MLSIAVEAPRPSLALIKVAEAPTPVTFGDPIAFRVDATNTGNVTLTDLTVEDAMLPLLVCPTATLAPDETVSCSAGYTVTDDDVTTGAIRNTASATATAADGRRLPPVTDTVTVLTEQPVAALHLVKTAAAPTPASAGDLITYQLTVTNTGSVTLHDVTLHDPSIGDARLRCETGENVVDILTAGSSSSCTGDRALTQADIDHGSITNAATATGSTPDGQVTSADASVTTLLLGPPVVSLIKTASLINDVDGNGVTAGDTITYTFDVTNSGTTTVTDFAIDDPMLGGSVPCDSHPLPPGHSTSCPAVSYTLLADDLGTILHNTATVVATMSGGSTVTAVGHELTAIPATCPTDLTTDIAAPPTTTSTIPTTPPLETPSTTPATTTTTTTPAAPPPPTASSLPSTSEPVTAVDATTADSTSTSTSAPSLATSTSSGPAGLMAASDLRPSMRCVPAAPVPVPPPVTAVPPNPQQPDAPRTNERGTTGDSVRLPVTGGRNHQLAMIAAAMTALGVALTRIASRAESR